MIEDHTEMCKCYFCFWFVSSSHFLLDNVVVYCPRRGKGKQGWARVGKGGKD